MKCFEIASCTEQERKACYVWASFQTSPQELENIKCWVIKGAYQEENKAQLKKCRRCTYYNAMQKNSSIASDCSNDETIITCNGSLNNDQTRALETVWNKLTQNSKWKIILDITLVNNIYSCGLGLLVKMHKDVEAKKGMMVITGAQGYVLAIFNSTKLSRIFHMAPDRRAALEKLDEFRRKQEEALKKIETPVNIPPKKRIPCWQYWEGHNPKNATRCDECFKKVSPSKEPCWIVEGMIEGISFQYVNEECEGCSYFYEFASSELPKIADSDEDIEKTGFIS